MRKIILLAAILACSAAQAQQANGTGQATSGSQSGAQVYTGVNFAGSEAATRVHTTPTLVTPPSAMGGANNCGQADTFAVGITGMAAGGSRAGESKRCNDREDTFVLYKLGMLDAAKMRFVCFGSDDNRMAFEATGGLCPASATAKGLAGNLAAAPADYLP